MNLDLTVDEAERLSLMAFHGIASSAWISKPDDDAIRFELDRAIMRARREEDV